MKNWRTTLIGIAGAIAIVVGNWLQTGNLTDTKTLIAAIVAACLGYFAKDAGVSGTEK
jgi:hypothetical protein